MSGSFRGRLRWRYGHRPVLTRAGIPLVLLAFALVYGTVGYWVLEGFGLIDALYMTVTTLTTVGFGEIQPLSPAGRVFTISLITVGVVTVFDVFALFTSLIASGRLNKILGRRSMDRNIESLRDHYIICAYGRVGRAAARELSERGAEVVVVERQPELEALLAEAGVPYVLGDSTQEAALVRAGIHRARGLLCAVDSDAVNVYIALTARALNPELFIIARASSAESVDKLHRAGSDRVVSPYVVSGARMASMALSPAVLEFADMVSVASDLRVEELLVGEGSRLVSRTISDVCDPYEGVMVLAVRKPAGELMIPPRADTVLHQDDFLILVGPVAALEKLADEAMSRGTDRHGR
ncbi:MAG TPA: potassium channel protein [Acidimicrobiales bacterium]|nr:potassium channel protein [Acidimicrobiales bacterium]